MNDLYQEPLHMSTTTAVASLKDDSTIKQVHPDYVNMKTNTCHENNIKHETDSAVSLLLARLDEGTQTIANLRSILTLKTAELNELMAQLEMTHQAITHVESTTGHIETMLKELGLSSAMSCGSSTTGTDGPSTRDLLISAEASLDSAIKSAIHIYSSQEEHIKVSPPSLYKQRPSSIGSGNMTSSSIPCNNNSPSGNHYENKAPQTTNHPRFVSRIRYKPDTKHLLRQLTDRLRDLELDAGKFFETIGTTTDVQALQKAYVDLDLAETIALSAKSNLKRRKILLTSSRRRNGIDQVKLLGDKIREGVDMWKTYTRNAPMKVNGEDILVILELQDNLLDKNATNPSSRMSVDIKSRGNSPTNSTSSSTTHSASNHRYSSSTWRQSSSSGIQPSGGGRHRSSSISSVSSIPVLSTHQTPPPPVPPLPSQVSSKKTVYRHSTTSSSYANNNTSFSNTISSPRAPIKANLGVSRVRTSSLTNKAKEHHISSSTKTHLPSPPSNNNTISSTTTAIITTATPSSYDSTNNATGANTAGVPKTMLKVPSQRGPGSTLRIRSMLAKRNHHQPGSTPSRADE